MRLGAQGRAASRSLLQDELCAAIGELQWLDARGLHREAHVPYRCKQVRVSLDGFGNADRPGDVKLQDAPVVREARAQALGVVTRAAVDEDRSAEVTRSRHKCVVTRQLTLNLGRLRSLLDAEDLLDVPEDGLVILKDD